MAVHGVRATQTAVTAHLHHSTRILHNSQYPTTPHFFTHHLRTGWSLRRTHKNAWFERVSPHSQKAVLSDHLPMETLPLTAETRWGIRPEGHQGPWRPPRSAPLSWMSLLHPSTGRQEHCAQRTTPLPITSVSPCCPPPPQGPSPHLL